MLVCLQYQQLEANIPCACLLAITVLTCSIRSTAGVMTGGTKSGSGWRAGEAAPPSAPYSIASSDMSSMGASAKSGCLEKANDVAARLANACCARVPLGGAKLFELCSLPCMTVLSLVTPFTASNTVWRDQTGRPMLPL